VNSWLLEQQFGSAKSAIGLVVDTGCSFYESTSFPEVLDVLFGISHIGRSSVKYKLGIFREGAELPAAQGHFVHAYVGALSRSKCHVPEDVRKVLATHMLITPE
jgi:acyl-CoA thioester hydrolase